MDKLMLAVALGFVVEASARAEDLIDAWNAARKGGEYRQPDRDELRRAEDLFRRTLKGDEKPETLEKAWAELRFELTRTTDGGMDLLVLREHLDHKTGRGFYLFRRDRVPAIALQAPHATEDLHTGRIALHLFQEGEAAAGAWSTVRREDADMAHLAESYFQAFTRAFARTHRLGVVAQLHGFEAGKRKTEAGEAADVVLSNGTRKPPAWLLTVATRWKGDVIAGVKVYPDDVKELGATTNAQGLLLQDLGHDGFLHVEMNLELREKLRKDAKVREALWKGLHATFQKSRGDD